MIRKIPICILIALGIAVTVINPLIMGILAAGVWIYLVMMYRKQKNIDINDQMGLIISESHMKRMKAFLIVTAFSFFVFIVGAVVHNVLHGLYGIEDLVFLIVSIVALIVFVVTTAGALFVFLKGRYKAVTLNGPSRSGTE